MGAVATTTIRESRKAAAFRALGSCAFVGIALGTLAYAQSGPPLDPMGEKVELGLAVSAAFFSLIALRWIWTMFRPGILTIGPSGINLDQGWRKRSWTWQDLSGATVLKSRLGFDLYCFLRCRDGEKVALFGWEKPPREIADLLERQRPCSFSE